MITTKEYPKNDEVTVSEISVTYTQENENDANEFDNLELSIGSVGAGFYFVMKTDRWAFDNIDEFIKLLEDFKQKSGI